jgi:hypothetical protein
MRAMTPHDPEDYGAGRPDHHDPTAGFGGAPPASSALTLRAFLAVFGLVVCVGGAVAVWVITHAVAATVFFALLAVAAAIDLAVVVGRKRRGEPG